MAPEEVIRRLRLVALSIVIITAFGVAGVWVDFVQQREIHDTQQTLKRNTLALLGRDCRLVVGTADVFVNFIKKEIALRAARERSPNIPPSTRAFDHAEVFYWTHVTLPQLRRVYEVHCPGH